MLLECLRKLQYYPEGLFMFYLYGVLFSAPILEQYLFKVFSEEVGYNYTFNADTSDNNCDVGPINSTKHQLLIEVQDRISKFQLLAMISQNIPAVLLILFFGPLSDRIGRKPIMLIGFAGYTAWCILLTLIVSFSLDVRLVYIANFIWGCSGYYISMVVAIIAYVADTTDSNSRPFRIAIVDFALFLAITSSNFSSGVILQAYGFLVCFILMLVIAIISSLICIFFLKESLPVEKRASKDTSILFAPKIIYEVLKKDRPNQWKLKLLIPLDSTIGFTAPVTILQVLVLILLNIPFCWPSSWIGYYRGTLFVIMGLGGVVAVKLLPIFINKATVIVIANISSAGYLVAFALARTKLTAYLSILAGIFAFSSQPITRGLISQSVGVDEQGAVFSLLGFFQTIVSLAASLSYNAIYIYTNQHNMPAAVFIIASGTMVVPIFICLIYYIKDRQRRRQNDLIDNGCEVDATSVDKDNVKNYGSTIEDQNTSESIRRRRRQKDLIDNRCEVDATTVDKDNVNDYGSTIEDQNTSESIQEDNSMDDKRVLIV